MAEPGVQSVERALDLLEILAELGGDAGLSELSEQSGLPLPTIHRLMRPLSPAAMHAGCPRVVARSARG